MPSFFSRLRFLRPLSQQKPIFVTESRKSKLVNCCISFGDIREAGPGVGKMPGVWTCIIYCWIKKLLTKMLCLFSGPMCWVSLPAKGSVHPTDLSVYMQPLGMSEAHGRSHHRDRGKSKWRDAKLTMRKRQHAAIEGSPSHGGPWNCQAKEREGVHSYEKKQHAAVSFR
jgi:hypothetical protein